MAEEEGGYGMGFGWDLDGTNYILPVAIALPGTQSSAIST